MQLVDVVGRRNHGNRGAVAGRSVTFEFLSDRPGTFPFYCNLTLEDGCREMKGQLVVRP